MMTLENIIKEIQEVPDDRLEELYQFIQSLTPGAKATETMRNKILSYAGAFSDMKDSEFDDFINQTKEIRKSLFDRKVNL